MPFSFFAGQSVKIFFVVIMKTGIASDHGGYELKEAIKEYFPQIEWVDYGCDSTDSVDYPDFAKKLANGILENKIERGVAICGTGIGISIALNRFKDIRAALCHDLFTAEMCRLHNDANIIALGGRIISKELAFDMIDKFFKTGFEGGRHANRIKKIEDIC